MELTLSKSDNEFIAAAQEFLTTHWRTADALVTGRRGVIIRDRYLAALAASGRLVGQWPTLHGGLSWTARERWLWEREVEAVQAPQAPANGPDLLAPLLLQHGSSAQQAQHLPAIATDRVHWCQALGEDSGALDINGIATVATPLDPATEDLSTPTDTGNSGWHLSGTKPWVLDLPADATGQATWAYVLARVAGAPTADRKVLSRAHSYGLFLVDLAAAGVSIQRRAMVGESPEPPVSGRYMVGSLTFNAVALPVSALLGPIDGFGSLGLAIEQAEFAHPGAVARNSVLLEQLRTVVETGELDGGSLWRDSDYRARLHDLEVTAAGLQARWVRHGSQSAVGGRQPGARSGACAAPG